MKSLLYITVNSKPENLSVSKTVGRVFVNEFIENNNDIELKEIDLYDVSVPKLKYQYFKDRHTLVDTTSINKLTQEEQKDVARIKELAEEFKKADIYVLAVPMWSMMFPSPLKEYLDCVIQNDITVKISPEEITGLLNDKERKMIYIQSSGGPVPWILEKKMNHGGTYLKDLFKFVGIKDFYEILVDNTGFTEKETRKAIEKGKKDALSLCRKI